MQSKSQSRNQLGADPHSIPPTGMYSEPWWRGVGYNSPNPPMMGANVSNSSSLNCPNDGSESNDDQSLSNDGPNEEDDDDAKESKMNKSPRSGII